MDIVLWPLINVALGVMAIKLFTLPGRQTTSEGVMPPSLEAEIHLVRWVMGGSARSRRGLEAQRHLLEPRYIRPGVSLVPHSGW